jgi:hypothetical protein
MKLNRFTLLVATLLLTTLAAVAQQAPLEPSASNLQKHISYLASDELDGRRTGTAGADEAARYVAGEFARLRLKPGVARYLQPFPYVAGVSLGPITFFHSAAIRRRKTRFNPEQIGYHWPSRQTERLLPESCSPGMASRSRSCTTTISSV